VSRAALEAGKERRDLGKLLKRHGINPRQFVARGEPLGGLSGCGLTERERDA
jgi:hypothetical protein